MSTRGWWRATGMVVCALMIATMSLGLGAGPAAARSQQATQEPEVTPTPVVGSATGQLQTAPEESPTAEEAAPESNTGQTTGPVASGVDGDTAPAVLAQGLVYLNGDDVVWQVREVELSGSETVTGNARILLQRTGTSVVRNDLTGKRARLESGEAYFASAGDPYTTFKEGSDPSVMWVFEIANDNTVGEGAFYLSPNVSGYGESVYDFEFVRNVLAAGGSAQFDGGDGSSLIMVLSGSVDVTSDSGTATLSARDGLVVPGGASIAAGDSEAVVVTMAVGPTVGDSSAAPPAPAAQDTASADATEIESSAPTVDQSSEPAQSTGDGGFVTSIQVGVLDSVGITMYVDGELVFDGWLEPGEWTDFFTGTTFEVYTTSGANTQFQNTCGGEPFWMDFTEGDAYYVLEASAESCAPV